MDAVTLNCPTCGAAAAPGATACTFCRARLATVGCPSCFGLVFVGSRHCAHCGARTERPDAAGAAEAACPRGCGPLTPVQLGGVELSECGGCGGVWLSEATFQRLCADGERQATLLAGAAAAPRGAATASGGVRYLPCPQCAAMMNRVNFARVSGVVIDSCREHGVWFDADELRRVVEFVRAGGLDVARGREREALAGERRLQALRRHAAGARHPEQPRRGGAHDADATGLLSSLLSLRVS